VTNNDGVTHTFTSVSGPAAFNSGQLGKGASASVTFTKAGGYSYHCSIHTSMTGSITVH
jgi:plastocyanin